MNAQAKKSRRNRVVENKSAALVEYLDPHLGAIINIIRDLVLHESPSHDKRAVDKLGRYITERFRSAKARVTVHGAEKYGDHVQADFDGRGKPILLLGHHDTVWDLGTIKTMPFKQEHGRLHGPGVLDMKTGIAQMLFAIDALRSARGALPRAVTALLVSDEEVGSESSREITERLGRNCAAVLVLEPSFGLYGALKTARKGVGDYTIRVHGHPAHAGLDPRKGASAILELSRQLLKIEKFTDFKTGVTVNPGVIRGGTRTNVIAAEASCDVDIRISELKQAAMLGKKFHSLRAIDSRCRVEIEGGINRPPLERTPTVARLFKMAQSVGSEIGLKLKEAAVGGGSDGNFTAALGVPTLDGLGAVGEGAHAINESVLVDQLIPRTALLARLIEEI